MAGVAAVQLKFKAVPVPRQGGRQILAAADVSGCARRNAGGQCQGKNAFFSGKVGRQQPAAARGQGAEHGHAARRPAEYRQQFAQLFLDLQKKCDSAEISTKALDLRGMLDALRLIRRGIPAGAALDMGITNKAFDSYEQGLIRDVIAARIPAKLDAGKLFA